MEEFFARLKEHKLVQWMLGYMALSFALIPVLDIVAQNFGWPRTAVRCIIIALITGFFMMLVIAWYHGERGEQRITRTEHAMLTTLLVLGALAMWQIGPAAEKSSVPSSKVKVAAVLTIPEKSVAVLPLANESGNKDEQYFSDGLSENLITALSQFAELKVISRNSSFQFRDTKDDSAAIGRKLGVAHLLEGSVQRAGDVVRVSAELVNAADGSTLWSQRYDRPYKDLFKLQDDITAAVADALKTKLLSNSDTTTQSERPPSGSLAAYNAYLQGNFHLSRHAIGDLQMAADFYQQAIRLDPHYALALAKLSLTWSSLGNRAGGADAARAYARARTAATQALALNANLAEAHYALGSVMMSADWNFPGAQAQFLLAEAASDVADNGLAVVLARLGEMDAAIRMQRKAIALDPRQASYQLNLAIYLIPLGRYDEAVKAARAALALQPAKPAVHVLLAIIAIKRGDATGALREAKQEPDPAWKAYALALAQYARGNAAAADAALNSLIADHSEDSPFQIATVYASRGEANQAFEWLDRALAARDPGVTELLFNPFLSALKNDPRFAAFCRKIGLPVPASAAAPTPAHASTPATIPTS